MTVYAPIIEMCLLSVHEKGESAIKTIFNCSVPSQVMLMQYDKLPTKIESLPKEERQEMWEAAYAAIPEGSREERIRYCKLIHVIGTLL